MNQMPSFPWLAACARLLLEPQAIERVVTPTIADALHERSAASSERTWLWHTRMHLASAIAVAAKESASQRCRQIAWAPFFALGIAGWSGISILRLSPAHHSSATAHGILLTIGALCALVVVATPRQLLRKMYYVAAVCAALATSACPWFGESFDGYRQWLCIGRFHGHVLVVHVSTLFLPAFAVFVGHAVSRGNYARLGLSVAVCMVFLGLQPNWQAIAVYACVLAATVMYRRIGAFVWLLCGAVVSAGVLSTFLSHEYSTWALIGNASLVLAMLWSATMWRARAVVPTAMQTAAVAAMLALTAMSGWVGDMLPVVGFGGSAIVALFALLALQARAQHHA